MAVRQRTLSLENLESRLNLSGLGGLSSIRRITPPVTRAQDTSVLTNIPKVTSLTDYTRVVLTTTSTGATTSTSFGTGITAPANLSTTQSGTGISLKWTGKSDNSTGYRVYRSTDGVNFELIGTVGKGKSSYTDLTAVAGTDYTYGVAAYNSGAQSVLSNLSENMVQLSPPAAPTQTQATAVTSSSVSLSWFDDAKDESGFHVYRSDDGENYSLVADLGADSTSFTDSGLNPGTSYSYEVSSWSAAGEAYAMSSVSVVTQTTARLAPAVMQNTPAMPAAPGNVAFSSVTNSGLTINWTDAATNETGYHIYRSTDGVNFTQIASLAANSTSFADSGLASGVTYAYRIAAYNTAGESTSQGFAMTSQTALSAGQTLAPNAPSQVIAAKATTSTMQVTWTDNSSNEGGFNIYRSTDGVNYTKVGFTWANNTYFMDVNLSANTTYMYKISAWSSDGESFSAPAIGTTATSSATLHIGNSWMQTPNTPTSIGFSSVTTGGVTVNWSDPNTNQNGFSVYRSTDGLNYTKVADVAANVTSFSDTGLTAGTNYYYRVSAWNNAGQTWSSSALQKTGGVAPIQILQVAPVVVPAPVSPTALTVTSPTLTSLSLSWSDAAGDETGFNVYRSTDGTNYTLVTSLSASTTSFVDTGLSSSTAYNYKITAVNAGGETASSVAGGTTMTPVVAPNAPANVTFANITTSGLTVNWTDTATNETGYHVYRSTDGVNFTDVADLAANASSFTDTGLSNATTYFYKIAAWNSAGQTGTTDSQTTATAAPSAPGSLTVSNPTLSSLQLSWTDTSSNESGFRVYRSTDGTNFSLIGSLAANVTSFTDMGLSSSTQYTYKVSAWNAGGETVSVQAGSTTLTPVVAPNAPASVTFANITTGGLTLNWTDAATNESGYRVYRSTDGVNYTKIVDLAANSTSFSDTGLSSATTYYYKIAAWNSAGETTTSVSQATAVSAPSAPTQLSVNGATTSSLQLSWTDTSSNESGFRVYRSTDGTNFTLIGSAAAGSTTYTDTGLSSSTTYTYKVSAWNSGGETASSTSTGTTQAIVVAPNAPANITFANITTTGLTLNWTDAASNETGYRVYRSTDGVNFTKVADLAANSTSFADSGLSNNTTYYYKVTDWNSAGETAAATISQKTALAAPSMPGQLTISNPTISSLQLSWTDTSNNESGFKVYRSTDGTNFTLVSSLAANTTTFTDTGLSSNTQYTYKISAWNSAAEVMSSASSGTTLVVAPSTPGSVTFSNITTAGLTIHWADNATNESGYHVYRSTDGTNFTDIANLAANSTSFSDTGLSSATTYYYKIAAWNSAGETSATAVSQQTAVAAPNAPSLLTVNNASTSSLQLSWTDNSSNESGFKVYRSTDGTNFTLVTSLAANVTTFTDTGLASNTQYTYKISAWNSAAEVTSSATSGTTQAVVVAPNVPASITFANVSTSGVTVNWTDTANNETGYRVYRSTDGVNFTKVADLAANSTSFADSGLSSSTTYYYKVSDWNSAGETTSAASSTTTQTVVVAPAAPTSVTASGVTTTGLTLNWTDAASNESGYGVYRSTDGVNFTKVADLAANSTSFVDSGLSNNTTYYYKVTDWNSAGETAAATISQKTALAAPSMPGQLTISSPTISSLQLAWTDTSSNESGFHVYRSTNGGAYTLVGNLTAGVTSFSDTGLASNTTYSYKVASWNAAGETSTTAASGTTLVVAPSAPASVTFANITTAGLTLNWSDTATNESGYHVYRSTDGTNFTDIANLAANTTSFSDTGLSSATTYYYKIAAWNSAGETSATAVSQQTAIAAPNAPSLLTVSNPSISSLQLAWTDNSSNESGFKVYRSTDGTNFTLVTSLAANVTAFTDTGLTSNTQYTYKISAWNSAAEVMSSASSGTTLVVAPSAPGSVTFANVTTAGLTINWADNATNESGYHVYRSTDGTNFTDIANLAANSTSFADSGLSSGTTYYYKIAAWNSAGETSATAVSQQTVVAAPSAPTSLTISGPTISSLQLNWVDNSSNETGFHVYRSTDGTNFTLIGTAAANATTFQDTGLMSGKLYTYKVSAYNAGGETNSVASAGTTSVALPTAPSNTSFANITTSSMTVSWTDNSSNETGFHVYRSTDGTNFTDVADVAANTTSFSNTGLTAGTTYYYKIASFNSAGQTTATVATQATNVAPPAAPSAVSFASVTATSLTVNWTDNATNETGYRVYRSTDGTNFTKVADLAAGTTTYADSGLTAGTTYYYKITAWNSAAETPAAVAAQSTIALPAAPSGVNFSAVTSSGITVNWTDNANNETGYRVYRSTDGVNFTKVADLAAGTKTFADTGLSASTTYYYKVSAWNSAGEISTTAASTATIAPVSSGVTISTSNMTSFTELDINGTSANDSILVTQSGNVLTVTANGQATTYAANLYGNIVIHGGNGNDNITVSSSVNIITLVYGGDGNDVIKNQTSAKATIVTIGNGTNVVTGNGINTSYWVNPGDTVNATAAEIALGGVNRVASFYQPFTTDPTNASYVPRTLHGQNLTDPTDSGTTKRLTNSSFWGLGPNMNDIVQTSLSDCYFLAPLSSLAYAEPQELMNTGVDLGDGTYAFRFVRNGVTTYVRVDGDLAVGGWGYGLANATPGADGNQWGSLFEKAYAFFRYGSNTYASLDYGFQTSTLLDLGFSTNNVLTTTGATTILNQITTQVNANHAIAASTNYQITDGAPIIASHVYSVLGAYLDPTTNTVMIRLRNPWGVDGAGNDGNNDGIVTITYQQFSDNFTMLTWSTS